MIYDRMNPPSKPTQIKQAITSSAQLYKPFIKVTWLGLLSLFIFTEILQHYFHFIAGLTRTTESANLPAILGQILTSLLEFVVFSMLVPLHIMPMTANASAFDLQARTDETFTKFTQKHIHALTAESLRALGLTMLWSLALILPGFFKYVRYTFMPYVVVADPVYQRGERDALAYSNDLIKGFTGQVLLLILVFMGTEFTRDYMRDQYPLMQSPVIAIMAGLLFFAFNIYANILLFRLYQIRVKVKSELTREKLGSPYGT